MREASERQRNFVSKVEKRTKSVIGHKTESIYRRYSMVDPAMLEMGTSKLETLQQTPRTSRPVVVSMQKRARPSR